VFSRGKGTEEVLTVPEGFSSWLSLRFYTYSVQVNSMYTVALFMDFFTQAGVLCALITSQNNDEAKKEGTNHTNQKNVILTVEHSEFLQAEKCIAKCRLSFHKI
jgi:hypothetical protein